MNVFEHPDFSWVRLTQAMNMIPNTWGLLNSMNFFPARPITQPVVKVEWRNGVLHLLKSTERGGPASQGSDAKRKIKYFGVPHFPHEDVVHADDVNGVRAFGSDTKLEAIGRVVNDKLIDMRGRHDITLEWLRMGAFKGLIKDGDNSDLINLFDEFNVTKKSVNIPVTDPDADLIAVFLSIKGHIEDNLLGDVMSHVEILLDPTFFAEIIAHKSVEKAWQRYRDGEKFRIDNRAGFEVVTGVVLREYRAKIPGSDKKTSREFIAENKGHAAPAGTRNTFYTAVAPGDFMETVNTKGKLFYAKREPMKYNRGMDLHTQSNPLPMCSRPGVLVELNRT